MNNLLTIREIAEKLRITPLTIKRKLKSGEIKGIKIGARGDWRVREEELNIYLGEKNE